MLPFHQQTRAWTLLVSMETCHSDAAAITPENGTIDQLGKLSASCAVFPASLTNNTSGDLYITMCLGR